MGRNSVLLLLLLLLLNRHSVGVRVRGRRRRLGRLSVSVGSWDLHRLEGDEESRKGKKDELV